MKYLTLQLPGGQRIDNPPNFNKNLVDLSSIISILFEVAIFVGVFLAFYYLVWGAFQYIVAQGKKEDLAKARARITWAIIGLAVVVTAYLIATYASEIFPPDKGGLPF